MGSLFKRFAGALRIVAYRAHRASKPKNWVHTLDEQQLEREVGRWYYSMTGERMDFDNPRSFNQKLQWLKVHDNDPRKSTLSDKLAVRETIAREVGDEVLPRLYASWDSAEQIDFTGLPKRFFLKCNNGSGMMKRIDDVASADMEDIRARAALWLTHDFASTYLEMHYADITPKVYAEELLDDIEWEYQAWCFGGKVEFIAAINNPHGVNQKQFFSPTWEKLPFVSSPPEYQGTIERPEQLEQIIEWSERLASDFTFVRVDWYGTRYGLMFSEMSFTPAYGIVHWQPATYNDAIGALINLPNEG